MTCETLVNSEQGSDKLRRNWAILLTFAAALRVTWALAVPMSPISDSRAYDILARSLASGQGFGLEPYQPTGYWSVGPAFVYSLFFRVFGHSYVPIVVFQVVVSVASVWLAMWIARHWFGDRVALVSGGILACWPSQIQFTTVLASELMFSFLVLAAVALWIQPGVSMVRKSILCGVVIGMASYMRATSLLLPVVLGGSYFIQERRLCGATWSSVVMLAIVVAIAAPWSVRNTRAFGTFCSLTSNFGINFWQGNNPDSVGWYRRPPVIPELEGRNEAEVSKYFGQIAKTYVRDHPLAFVGRSFLKVVRQHCKETIGVAWNATSIKERYSSNFYDLLRYQSAAYFATMVLLALISPFFMGRKFVCHPTILIWGYFASIHGIVLIQDRYNFQSAPFIAMLSSISITHIYDRVSRTR